MRIALTIDNELAKLLDQEVELSEEPFEATVNRLLRAGLEATCKQVPREGFEVTPFELGIPSGYDCTEELIEFLEGPFHKEARLRA